MIEGLASREVADQPGKGGRPGRAASQVEDAGLILVVLAGQEGRPVVGAEQRPGGHRLDRYPALPEPGGGVPRLLEPAQLLLAGAAVVALRDRQRQAIALPRFAQHPFQSVGGGLDHPHGLHVGKAHELVAAATFWRVALRPVVEEPVAGQIVVHADDIGRAGGLGDRLQPRLQTETDEPAPHGVTRPHEPAKQVPAQPAPIVVEGRLMRDRPGRIGAAEILRLDQPGRWIDLPDRRHGEAHAIDLVQQDLVEAGLVQEVRMPKTIERREPGRGQRLVHGRPVVDPRISLRDRAGETGEPLRKTRIHQVGVGRARAMMDKSGDRTDTQLAQAAQALVGPGPVETLRRLGRDPFPQHGVS